MKNKLKTLLSILMIISVLIKPTFVYATENKSSETEKKQEIEVTYSTGTQQNAKDRMDETKANADEDDGSYEEIILNDSYENMSDETEEIHISTADDLIKFSKNCRLDTWSGNKRVLLDNDITLIGSEFATIPTFGGYFDGCGHTIEGFIYSKPVSYFGLFSYIQENAIVKNLTFKASIKPSGKQIITGGIAGDNSGQIVNCTFEGTVEGYNYVGGIAGYNELTGIISGCNVSGSISGQHYTGGIAGENVGLISNCINSAKVNTTIIDKGMSLEEIDISSVTSGLFSMFGENSDKNKDAESTIIDSGSIDSGGIAGLSIGVIQFCTNSGEIGYEHVGYNTGGIAGRQSGYINSCMNLGHIYGRKDIGGIVGQAEPYVVVDFTEDVINKLNESINTLHDIVAVTIDDAGDQSDTVSSRLNVIKDFTDKALDSTAFLSDRTVEWTDGVVGSVNELTGRAEYILKESSKSDGPVNDTKDAFSDTEEAAKDLKATVNDLNIRNHMSEQQRTDYDNASAAFEEAVKIYAEYTANEEKYSRACYNKFINDKKSEGTYNTGSSPEPNDLIPYDKNGEVVDLTTDPGAWNKIPPDKNEFVNVVSWKHADGTVFPQSDNTDDQKLNDDANTYVNTQQNDIETAANAETRTKYSYTTIPDVEDQMTDNAAIMAGIVIEVTPAMEAATRADAEKTAKNLESAAGNLKDAGTKTGDIISNVANRGSITFPKLGDEYRQKTNSLVAALQGMSDNMGLLNGEMSDSSDVLLSDMGDVNDQFNEIMRLYADAIDGVLDNDYSEMYDDKSMLVAETCTDATVASSENKSFVDGDINVSGIAGTMGIEYDFDLESDITGVKDASLTSVYQSKCVMRGNKNRGAISANKSCLGGICGLQEMGTIIACENYGRLKSSSGDYVGGIAGDSQSYIQKSYSKCTLYGEEYVAGIAGSGTNILNCYSMVRIMDAKSNFGAIAGSVSEEGKVRYNYFVSDDLAGIDRVSYYEKAEPVDYYVLTGLSGIPSDFLKFDVVFYSKADENADPEKIKTIELKYGQKLSQDDYPKLDDTESCYAKWDITCIDNIYYDEDITAEYKRFRTTIASNQERLNRQSAILVDGNFHEDDTLECKALGLENIDLENAYEHWAISFRDDGQKSHLVRYGKPTSMKGNALIYVNHAGRWDKAELTKFGEYETFEIPASYVEIVVCEDTDESRIYVIAGICVLAVLMAAVVLIIVIKRKKKRTTQSD